MAGSPETVAAHYGRVSRLGFPVDASEQCLTRSGSAYGARARDTMAVPAGPAGDGDGVETDDDGIADDDDDDRAALGQPPEPPADVSPALVGYGQSGKGPRKAQLRRSATEPLRRSPRLAPGAHDGGDAGGGPAGLPTAAQPPAPMAPVADATVAATVAAAVAADEDDDPGGAEFEAGGQHDGPGGTAADAAAMLEGERAAAADRERGVVFPDLDAANGPAWFVIGEVPFDDLYCAWATVQRDLPKSAIEDHASAVATILKWWNAGRRARDEARVDAALMWMRLLPVLFFRTRGRGGAAKKKGKAFAKRAALFADGDYKEIIEGYLHDRARHFARRKSTAVSGECTAAAVLEAVAAGALSKAARLATSSGIVELTPAVLEGLESKHPKRDYEIERARDCDDDDAACVDYDLDLRATYRALERRKAVGPDGQPPEHLQSLTKGYLEGESKKAMEGVSNFRSAVVNGKMPRWWYDAEATMRLVALRKPDGGVRPIGMGDASRRATGKAVAKAESGAFMERLAPVQVAVGVKNGAGILTLAVKLHLEENPTHVALKLDKANAYNNLHRRSILAALDGVPELAAYARYRRLVYAPRALIVADGRPLDFRSEEGGQQGDPCVCADYAWATHGPNAELHATLKAAGGAALFQVDDGYALGPPDVVYRAARAYGRDIAPLGEELRLDKSVAFCPALGAELAHHEHHESATVAPSGILVSGVPVGDPAFIQAHLAAEAAGQSSYINKILTKLSPLSLQATWCLLARCANARMTHVARAVDPDIGRPAFEAFDAAMLDAAASSFGEAGRFLLRDDEAGRIARRRLRMPVRFGGCGLRSTAETADAAFCAAVADTVPALAATVPGATTGAKAGFMPGLRSLRGFDPGARGHLRPFLGGSSPCAAAFGRAWGRLRAAVSDDDGHPPENGPLAEEAASAGAGREGHSQGAITGQIEARRAGVLTADLGSKPASWRPRAAHTAAQDTGARAFITAVPMEGLEIPNREWVECAALYLALPSPAMAAHVGVGVPCRGVDRANWPVIDEDGDVFFTNSRLLSRDSARARWSTALELDLHDFLHEAQGLRATHQPSGLFVDLLRGRAVRGGTDGLARLDDQKRRAVVPDLLWHEGEVPILGDVKTLAFCKTHYKDSDGSKREAVERKARSVVVDFTSKLRKIDKDILDTPQGQVGPLVQRFNSAYAGKVVGLVFGGFNEFSEDVHGLLAFAAKSLAEKVSAEDGFISVEHAEAMCLQRFVRRLGVVCARENARLRLRGLTFFDTHGKVRPYVKPYCERHWRLRQDAAVHWRLRRL